MKKLILTLFLLSGLAVFAKAQDTTRAKRTPEEKAAHMTQVLQKKLNLTADQNKQVSAILLDEANKTGDMKMKGVKGKGLARLEAANDASTKINAILTPDQQKTYAVLQQSVKDKAAMKKKSKAAADTPTSPAGPGE